MNRFSAIALAALLLAPVVAFAQSANDKLIQGIKAYNDELEWETAIRLLNDALQLGLSKASQIEAYKYLGFCYIETDQLSLAKEAFENVLNLDLAHQLDPNISPKYVDIFKVVKSEFRPIGERLLQKGIDAYNELEFKNATDHLERSLREKLPSDLKIEAHKYLAFCYIQDNQVDKAKSAFQKLLAMEVDYLLGDEFAPKYREVFNQVKAEMKPLARLVSVKSVPSGASVYFDGKLQPGKTPTMIKDVDTKTHSLKISLEGYEHWTGEISELSWEKSVMVQEKPTLEITAALVKIQPAPQLKPEPVEKKTGSIYAKSEPPSAQVRLDDVLQKGRTPTTIEDVIGGRHSLKLTLSGYRDWEQMINVEAEKIAEINAKLIPSPGPGPQQIPTVKKGGRLKWYLLSGTVVAAGGGVAAFLLSRGGSDDSEDTPKITPPIIKTTSLTIAISVP